MRIAAVCPIGYIDRWGYQRHLYECIGSFASRADHAVFVGSHRDTPGIAALLAFCPDAEFVCDERTWFERDGQGNEVFDFTLVNAAENAGLEVAKTAGCDVAIQISSNWYVSALAWHNIVFKCHAMLDTEQPYEWLYGADQLGTQMFHANVRYPWIVNLALGWQFKPIGALSDGGVSVVFNRGEFSLRDAEAIVDVPLEITVDELAAKMNYFRCYHDLLPKRNPVFDWGYWRKYYADKFRQKARSDAPPAGVGEAIARATQPDFVSAFILQDVGL